MRAYKITVCLAVLFSAGLSLFALEVDEAELKTTGSDQTIVFINYTGPHAKIDSLSSIKQIGFDMGEVISKSASMQTRAGSGRYYIIHAVDGNEKQKLDADILFIGAAASVDHIDNLRHIIASYLQSAYGYSEKDAQTIAVFVTVYNAVHRKNFEVFQNKYKKIVTDNITPENCGLSVNYNEWAGKSQIIIPLYDVSSGGISTVDTSVISDTEVVKRMQEDEDKSVDVRKDMVDLKEREAEKAEEKAQEAQKTAVQKTQQAQEIQKKADEAEKKADEARKKSDENPEDKKLKEEAVKAEKKADEIKKEAEEAKEEAEEAKEEAKDQQSIADIKNAEAQSERKEIAKDQQAVFEKELENSRAPAAYGIELKNEAALLSGLVKVNTKTGEIIKTSPVTVIRNRTMFQAGENFIAIAGENKGNGTVKLVLIDSERMEIVAESTETVAEDSVLVQDTQEYYVIIKNADKWVLAKYDELLNLKLKSPVSVKSTTPVTVAANFILVTGSDGYVKLLNKADLTPVISEQTRETLYNAK